MSKHNRVLYVNAPLDRITHYMHKEDPKVQKRIRVIKGEEKGIQLIQKNLWNLFPNKEIESINWIKSHLLFNWLNKRNNQRFANSILKAIKELNFTNYILFNDNDIFRSFYLKELLQPSVSIYYSRDYMLAVDYWKRHGTRLEPKLIAKSDVCVANSTYLADYCKQFNAQSYYVGQGCELEIFMNAGNTKLPNDLKEISKPIIGYVGALQSLRLSIEIITHIATTKKEWNIVLVGPEDDDFKKSQLHNLPNVFFLGSKMPNELPAYINGFDVCINPQIVSQITIGNYPRKIDEYLAVGKPVVATKTEAMRIFKDYCHLADTKEEYVKFINESLENNNNTMQKQRSEFASTHTWENSVNEIYQAIINSNKKSILS
jgi:glycosyltransferase involved in cell wall biosynthesis